MRELNLLAALGEIITPVGEGVLGPGDDAAVLPLDGSAVVSVDQTVSGIHADPLLLSSADFGWRAAATALSDLAAMGVRPTAVLIALAIPDGMTDGDLRELAAAADRATVSAGARIVGGDISSGPVLSASVTAVGMPQNGIAPVTRSGAQAGDLIGVTGQLGGSAAGLERLRRNADDPAGSSHRRPAALVAEGLALAAAGVTAMIDISDGIATDAGHIGRASGTRLEIDPEQLPVDPVAQRAADELGLDALTLATAGGEDFELLFTAPAEQRGAIEAAVPRQISWIGSVSAGEPGTNLADLGFTGWEHGG